jgi:ferredoxin-thioredoxin reductase catalytic subunit
VAECIDPKEIDILYRELAADAAASGSHLNPDKEFARELLRGLIANEKRYGYRSCPCRLASGNKEEDLDIICPCDYRDADVGECGTCFCALYVSEAVSNGTGAPCSIPERRPAQRKGPAHGKGPSGYEMCGSRAYPVWRCRVCGYLCAREAPPERCPICKAREDRFEKFLQFP